MQPAQQEVMDHLSSRLFATIAGDAGDAGPLAAAPIDDLDRNLGRTIDNAKALKTNGEQLKTRIDKVTSALNRPREVADALKGLSGDLGTLSTLLRVAQVVRVIRPVADVLRFQVDALRRVVDGAEGRARGLDRAVQPLRDRLRELSNALGGFLKRLDDLIGNVTGARGKVAAVRQCMAALPAGAVRDRGFALLDDFARSVNPPVAALAEAIAEANAQVAALNAGLATLDQQLEQLRSAIVGGIDGVRRVFGPVMGPLQELARALDYRIDIKIFSFSLRQILEGISLPWPFSYIEDLFWSAANQILEPILRALHLNIELPGIPGLELFDRIHLDFPGIPRLQQSFAGLPGLFDNLRGLLDRFRVDCPPAPQAMAYSEQLLAELAQVEPQLTM